MLLNVKKLKKEKLEKIIGVAVVASILMGISGYILSSTINNCIAFSIIQFIIILFLAFLIDISVKVFKGKGVYKDALGVVSYLSIYIGIGMIITAIFSTAGSLGLLFSFFIVVPLLVLGLSTLYAGIKELYKLDMITTFVIVSIVMSAVMIGAYIIVLFGLKMSMPMFMASSRIF